MIQNSAVALALDSYREPSRFRGQVGQPLPLDMLDLIRISAGDEKIVSENALRFNSSPEEVRAAADFFLRRSMMVAEQDAYRMLGLSHDSPLEFVKLHKRLLLKWLHPDRNAGAWKSALFNRVVLAAQVVESRPATIPSTAHSVPSERSSPHPTKFRHVQNHFRGQISKRQLHLTHDLARDEGRRVANSDSLITLNFHRSSQKNGMKRYLKRYAFVAALMAVTIFFADLSWRQISLNRSEMAAQVAQP